MALSLRRANLVCEWEGDMTVYGYARVSTNDQSLEAQLAELTAAGCGRVFREKISGKALARPELDRTLRAIGSGDVLIVTRLDRLARSTRDLLNTIKQIADAGATFKSLRDAWDRPAHWRRPGARHGQGCGVRQEAEADAPPTSGGHCAA
jgi:hypothetical protein